MYFIKFLKKIFYSGLTGAVFLTPLSFLQAHFGIIEFTHPSFLGLAAWVPGMFALIFVGMTLFFPLLEKTLTATFQFKKRNIFIEFLAILIAFTGPVFTQNYPNLLVLILGIYVLFRLGFFYAKWDWLFFLLGALIGPTVEIFLMNTDAYHFANTDFLGIPNWLPLLWGIVAMSGRRMADVIEKMV